MCYDFLNVVWCKDVSFDGMCYTFDWKWEFSCFNRGGNNRLKHFLRYNRFRDTKTLCEATIVIALLALATLALILIGFVCYWLEFSAGGVLHLHTWFFCYIVLQSLYQIFNQKPFWSSKRARITESSSQTIQIKNHVQQSTMTLVWAATHQLRIGNFYLSGYKMEQMKYNTLH